MEALGGTLSKPDEFCFVFRAKGFVHLLPYAVRKFPFLYFVIREFHRFLYIIRTKFVSMSL